LLFFSFFIKEYPFFLCSLDLFWPFFYGYIFQKILWYFYCHNVPSYLIVFGVWKGINKTWNISMNNRQVSGFIEKYSLIELHHVRLYKKAFLEEWRQFKSEYKIKTLLKNRIHSVYILLFWRKDRLNQIMRFIPHRPYFTLTILLGYALMASSSGCIPKIILCLIVSACPQKYNKFLNWFSSAWESRRRRGEV